MEEERLSTKRKQQQPQPKPFSKGLQPLVKRVLPQPLSTKPVCVDWFQTIECHELEWQAAGLKRMKDRGIKIWVVSFAGAESAGQV